MAPCVPLCEAVNVRENMLNIWIGIHNVGSLVVIILDREDVAERNVDLTVCMSLS